MCIALRFTPGDRSRLQEEMSIRDKMTNEEIVFKFNSYSHNRDVVTVDAETDEIVTEDKVVRGRKYYKLPKITGYNYPTLGLLKRAQLGKFKTIKLHTGEKVEVHLLEEYYPNGYLKSCFITNISHGHIFKYPTQERRERKSDRFKSIEDAWNAKAVRPVKSTNGSLTSSLEYYRFCFPYDSQHPHYLNRWIAILGLAMRFGPQNIAYYTDDWSRLEANHININQKDNRLFNVELCTDKQNRLHKDFIDACRRHRKDIFININSRYPVTKYFISAYDLCNIADRISKGERPNGLQIPEKQLNIMKFINKYYNCKEETITCINDKWMDDIVDLYCYLLFNVYGNQQSRLDINWGYDYGK